MSEPIYCGLAFGSVSVGPQGELRPCCGIVPDKFPQNAVKSNGHIKDKINHEILREVRRDLINGVWHPACQRCEQNENLGFDSMRKIWNRTINQAPMTELMDPESVRFLDLSLGSKCNSKCMTCGPGSSDFWSEEYAYIINSNPMTINPISIDETSIAEFVDTFKNTEHIYFIGGEPMIFDEHYLFLKKCIESGISERINLGYVTNLTVISESLIDMWGKFKSVGASISIDGVDKVNDYIRYPIKFNKVEDNLRRYLELIAQEKFGMSLSCTISLFNINEFADTLDFYLSLIEDIRKTKPLSSGRLGIGLNRVTNPDFFNSSILSTEYRLLGLEKIKRLRTKIEHMDLHHSILDACGLIEVWLQEPQINNPLLVEQAINFINKSDEFRNRNIDDYLPSLLDELKSYV